MSDFPVVKILESAGNDLNHFMSAFPTHLLLRTFQVKGSVGGAAGNTEYVGYALPGTTKGQPLWLIKKLIYDSTGFQVDAVFANNEAKFNKVFDSGASEYASYTYTTS